RHTLQQLHVAVRHGLRVAGMDALQLPSLAGPARSRFRPGQYRLILPGAARRPTPILLSVSVNMSSQVLTRWDPENAVFWKDTGSRVAHRNLWISIPALMLAFSIWMLWSVVVVNLDRAGFQLSKNQLFWLTALPALSGATLRIFYSFLVPVFGGRRWTAISTATLLIPARSEEH